MGAPTPAPADPVLARTMRLSVVEGALYALMAGLGEVYFVADAIRLGASAAEIVLVATLPVFVGSLGALGAVSLLRRVTGRRPLTVAAVLVQAAVLMALCASDAAGVATPLSLLALACLYQASGQAAGTAWSSWFGDLVPAAIRGDYFARRNRWVHLSTFLGLFGGGLLLQALEPGAGAAGRAGVGFALIFGLAAAFRLASAALLGASFEPGFQRLDPGERLLGFLRGPDGAAARRILPVAGGFLLAVAVASPFFAPFMLKELAFSYGTYMVAQAALVGAKLVVLPSWGRAVDRYGARQVYGLAAVLTALVPLPWVAVEGLPLVLFAQVLSGTSWGAYEVGLFTLMLDTTEPRHRPFLFAGHAVVIGAGQLLGGLLGTLLFSGAGLGYQALFFLSFAARLLLALRIPRLLGDLGSHPPMRRRQLLLRVVGLRPHGGPTLRPVDVPAPDDRAPAEPATR